MGSPGYAMKTRWRRIRRNGAVENDPTERIDNPNDVLASKRMADFVIQEVKNCERDNTTIAYDGKQQEFKEFCKAVYPNEEYNLVVNHERVYRFFFYTLQKRAFEKIEKTGKSLKKCPAALTEHYCVNEIIYHTRKE